MPHAGHIWPLIEDNLVPQFGHVTLIPLLLFAIFKIIPFSIQVRHKWLYYDNESNSKSIRYEGRVMASTKEYRDYILEQLSLVPGITCRPMMGEFLLYADGVLFGGIYDDRLLVKTTPGNSGFGMSEALPYEGAKKMYLVDEVDDKERLKEIVEKTAEDLGK